jgi:hypothetical protein
MVLIRPRQRTRSDAQRGTRDHRPAVSFVIGETRVHIGQHRRQRLSVSRDCKLAIGIHIVGQRMEVAGRYTHNADLPPVGMRLVIEEEKMPAVGSHDKSE